jgi:YD repeat-containing protein
MFILFKIIKKKHVIVVNLLLLALLTSCSSDHNKKIENPNSQEYQKLEINQELKEDSKIIANKVKERRVYSRFTSNYIKGGGKEILVEKTNYNEIGNKKERYRYRSDGVDSQWLYDYDEYGNDRSVELYDGFQKLFNKTNFEYSSQGILLKKNFEKNKSKTFYNYLYDDDYNLVEIKSYYKTNSALQNTVYKYHSGLLDSVIIYRNKFISQKIKFEHDSLGRREKESNIINNKVINYVSYVYDKVGNIIKLVEPKIALWKYIYDSRGNLLDEKHTDNQNNLQSRTTYKYDLSNDLMINKIRYDGTNTPALNTRYEYDFY